MIIFRFFIAIFKKWLVRTEKKTMSHFLRARSYL